MPESSNNPNTRPLVMPESSINISISCPIHQSHLTIPTPSRQACQSHVMIPIRGHPIPQGFWHMGQVRIGIIT